jgi:hypothetical protein
MMRRRGLGIAVVKTRLKRFSGFLIRWRYGECFNGSVSNEIAGDKEAAIGLVHKIGSLGT